ncbi:MAG TPA: hypothetical protein VE569_14510 [Acidimicrobiia bacterium]|nr:hypothetical protein [Acidimicrobiia bacterium]
MSPSPTRWPRWASASGPSSPSPFSGAGANIPEFVILSRLARTRVLMVFVGYVFAVAVVGGFLAQTIAS